MRSFLSKYATVAVVRVRGSGYAQIERGMFFEGNSRLLYIRGTGEPGENNLVIREADLAKLLSVAVRKGVFEESSLKRIKRAIAARQERESALRKRKRPDPFLRVIGIGKGDGKLAEDIDEELYGEHSL